MIIEGINQFSYNGKRSYDDMGLIITELPAFSSPERDITFTSVSGRSGDIVTDNKRFKNAEGKYKVAAATDTFSPEQTARKIKRWLQGEAGYFVLSDTYDPNYFRYACYSGQLDIENKLRLLGKATLKFNCKPFRYRIDGRQEIHITEPRKIYNPEDWESAPYIKIVGSGNITLSINNDTFAFLNVDGYIELDSEMHMAYKGTELQNDKVTFTTPPAFLPGLNNLSFTGAVDKIIIIPRWCCI